MKDKNKNLKWILIFLVIALTVLPASWWIIVRMESEIPELVVDLPSPEIGIEKKFQIHIQDKKSGLKHAWVGIFADGKESTLVEKKFPAAGFLQSGRTKTATLDVTIDPEKLGLQDGSAMLRLMAVDHSLRMWGKGNRTYIEKELVIDTRPPLIEILTKAHNINPGGAALVAYKVSEPCRESGVVAGENFFPGFPGGFKDPDVMLAFFALRHDQESGTELFLRATDRAENSARAGFAHHIRKRRVKKDTINISDRFLEMKMPEFEEDIETKSPTLIDKFLYVNSILRKKNKEEIQALTARSDAVLYWEGPFLRLPKSANRAGFADHRNYRYQNRSIDDQIHLGVDLASLANSPVPAANRGKIVFVGRIGIYGNVILIDHGFGLFSMYAHLSRMDVAVDDMVEKGSIIGRTGMSGLAGGDHLHFSVIIHQTFVNPIEWWDAAWIQNNITEKIATIGG